MLNQLASTQPFRYLGLGLWSTLFLVTPLSAQSPVKIKKYDATIDYFEDGAAVFELQGVASHLGEFTAYGQADLVPSQNGDALNGDGVVVFKAANGDLLVGIASWELGPADDEGVLATRVHFVWRDSIVLRDRTTVKSTGRFLRNRPPGLIVVDNYCCTRICIPLLGCFVRCEKCPTPTR